MIAGKFITLACLKNDCSIFSDRYLNCSGRKKFSTLPTKNMFFSNANTVTNKTCPHWKIEKNFCKNAPKTLSGDLQ
jgi:hypothetical protein